MGQAKAALQTEFDKIKRKQETIIADINNKEEQIRNHDT